jgi:radical SAM superfamily enzyme YgiQ (UPF0313 family)
MKLLLIDPPFKSFTGFFSFYFPLGLAYLAGSVKRAGFDCRILDMDAAETKAGTMDFSHEYERYQYYIRALNDITHPTWELMRTLVLQENPDVIGITAMTTKFGSVIQAARICKKLLPNVPIVVGGPHASAMPDLTMEIPEVDFVLRGEADESLPDLLIAWRDHQDLTTQRGLTWRAPEGVRHNPDRPFAQNLDDLPLPDRSALMHPENYSSEDMGVILTSRGCPFRCSYCFHMWDRRVRFRSVEGILAEMRDVHRRFGTTQFNFKDDSFTINKKHVMKLCEALTREPFNIGWACTTRVDILDDELVQTMKQGGCNVIAVGIESGSARVLQETDKDITHTQIRRAARLLNRHHVFWSGYFMVGLPDETEEEIRQTFQFLQEVRPYYGGLGVYNPFPRTKLFDQGVALGLLDPKPDIDHFLKTNPKDLFFRDPKKRVITMSSERFDAVVSEAMGVFQRHNRNPFNLVRRALARRKTYMHDPALLWRDVNKGLELAGLKFWSAGHP